mmetsp:Transcript_77492/g.187675  ORF Transcript_77492/g.187675 Transcript_77492/m.187675 type:complete len:338 (+) Transcript_77492:3190-4203(+)
MPAAGLAAALALGLNNPRPLAQLAARRAAPLGPLAQHTVRGLALGLAAVELAGRRLQLHALARHAGGAREEVVRRLLLEDGQHPLPRLRRRPALRAAVAKAGPLGPGAPVLLLALAGALARLLRLLDLARLAALVGHLGDAAVPVALAPALGARAPLRPLAVAAVFALVHGAGESAAGVRLAEAAVAELAALCGRAQDVAQPDPLAVIAGCGAGAPVAPDGELAGGGCLRALALRGRRAAGAGVAHLHLLQGLRLAALAPSAREAHDAAVPLRDAVALVGAGRPRSPRAQLAVHVRDASLCGLALIKVVLDAGHGLAALVGVPRDIAVPGAEAASAA